MSDVVVIELGNAGQSTVTTRNYTANEITNNQFLKAGDTAIKIVEAKARIARQLVALTNAINAAVELNIHNAQVVAGRALFNSIKNLTVDADTLNAAEILGNAIDGVIEQLKPTNLQA